MFALFEQIEKIMNLIGAGIETSKEEPPTPKSGKQNSSFMHKGVIIPLSWCVIIYFILELFTGFNCSCCIMYC